MKMFKVEIEFDKNLPAEQVEELCRQTDEIFAEENIPCIENSFGERIYGDTEEIKCGFGPIMCAILFIRDNENLKSKIIHATLFENDESEDLIDNCFSYGVA